jgi:superfamily II DNA or RNA helicase
MKATVEVGERLVVRGAGERLREALRLRLRTPHPGIKSAEAAGQVYRGERWWDPVQNLGDDFALPRGLLRVLRDQARRSRVELRWESRVVCSGVQPVSLDAFGISPRDYQREAVRLLHERVQGVVVLPCGGGKTTVGVLALLSLGQSAIVVVHTRDLLEQWVATLQRATGGELPIRIIGGGRGHHRGPLAPGEVCVGMVRSLGESPEVLASAAVVLVDEAHHAPARQWADLLDACPARWRWGLTATPERSDGWGFLLDETIGPVLYERTPHELVAEGYLRAPLVVPVRIPWKPEPDCYLVEVRCSACGRESQVAADKLDAGGAVCRAKRKCGIALDRSMEHRRGRMIWSRVLSRWTEAEGVVEAVAALGEAGWHAGRRNLTLVPRKRAAKDYSDRLARVGMQAGYVASGVAARAEEIEGLRSGRLDALVGTQLADEGLDVAEADLLVVVSAGRSKGLTEQRAGRVCRPAGAERPIVFDLVGDGLVYQWADRREAYERAFGQGSLYSGTPISLDEALAILNADKI